MPDGETEGYGGDAPQERVAKVLRESANKFHSQIAKKASHADYVNRVLELADAGRNVTHRQHKVKVYQYKESAFFMPSDSEYAYSVDANDVGNVTTDIVHETDYVVTYYDTDRLTDRSIGILGGPIAEEAES